MRSGQEEPRWQIEQPIALTVMDERKEEVPSYRVQRRVLSYQVPTQFDGLSPASVVDAWGNSSGMMSLFSSKSSLMHSDISSVLLSSKTSSMSCMNCFSNTYHENFNKQILE
ncbi:hypothetical protein HAX54_021827 [Datura stramonium]|uniref:Uncharacterized protein n=1 Tax=Datura stramonium TaxID=4076 RepID=A0ABS8S3Q2_DATST|nr:hypothetical protein [Datura stramonium]